MNHIGHSRIFVSIIVPPPPESTLQKNPPPEKKISERSAFRPTDFTMFFSPNNIFAHNKIFVRPLHPNFFYFLHFYFFFTFFSSTSTNTHLILRSNAPRSTVSILFVTLPCLCLRHRRWRSLQSGGEEECAVRRRRRLCRR